MDIRRLDYQTPPNGRPYALFLTALVLFVVVSNVLSAWLGTHLSILVSQFGIILGVALIYQRTRGPQAPRWPSLRRLGASPAILALVVVTAVAIGLLANVLGALIVELVPPFQVIAEQYREAMENLLLNATPFEQFLGIVAIAVAAPICEEVLFRGAILPEQRVTQGVTTAIVVNGLLFALMHLNPVSFVPLAIIGSFFAYLTIRTQSLWPAIIAHAALNTANGVVLPRLTEGMAGPEESASLLELLAAIAVLGVVAFGLWWLLAQLLGRSGRNERFSEPSPEGI
ncbi:MAG: CPBP family intramembrane metalloprotease [Bradymonadaceae bacterium]|nr:CPBP family intramembrane metalloprotease [Lujinxingiaceae bacterium]